MTQEEHLESSHQISNPVNDQVNDDSDKSKNTAASNQPNGARSNTISRDIDATDQAHRSGDRDRRESDRGLIDPDKLDGKISVVQSSDPGSNNLEMTVIKQQGSGENIRDIQTKIKSAEKDLNSNNVNDSTAIIEKDSVKVKENESVNLNDGKKEEIVDKSDESKVISTKCENSNKSSESVENEDPFARLKALKANISNVLREVKAVLSEHGEPPTESDNKDDIKPAEDSAIRFRFVRRIRKRSTFDEEDEKKTDETRGDVKSNDDTPRIQIDIPPIPEVSNSSQEIKELPEDKATLTQPDINKHSDIAPEPTQITTKVEAAVSSKGIENLSTPIDSAVKTKIVEPIANKDNHNATKKTVVRQNSNESIYQVTVVESQDLKQPTNVTDQTDAIPVQNKTPTEHNEQCSSNTNLQEAKSAPVYVVKVVETKPISDPVKEEKTLLKQEQHKNEAIDEVKQSTDLSKTKDKTKSQKDLPPTEKAIPQSNEPLYEVKVVESTSIAEPPKDTTDVSSTSLRNKASKKGKTTSTEKSQVKLPKAKSTASQSSQRKEKLESKPQSEKSDTSSEKTKIKKAKSDAEPSKKIKKISKSESLSQEDKPKSGNATNGAKSKAQKVATAVTDEKEDQKEKKDTKTPSKEVQNEILVPTKSVVPEPAKNASIPLIETSQPVVSKEVVSITKNELVPVPHKVVDVVENKKVIATPEKTTVTAISQKGTIPKVQTEKPKEKQIVTERDTSSQEMPLDNKSSADKSDLDKKISPKESAKETEKVQSKPFTKENTSECLPNQQQAPSKVGDDVIKSTESFAGPKPDITAKEKLLNLVPQSNSTTQQKSEPASALAKVLATTNLKLSAEIRPPSPRKASPSKDQIIPTEKLDIDTTKSLTTSTSVVQKHASENHKIDDVKAVSNQTTPIQKPSLSPVASTKDKPEEVRRYSLPASIPTAVPQLKTSATSSLAGEQIEPKPEVNNATNQHASAVKEKKIRDANEKIQSKIGSADILPKNDAETSSQAKPVDKVKIPLKIASDKIGSVAAKPTLTLLPSPTKAVQLAPAKLELVPISEPSQVLVRPIVARKGKGLISSETNEPDQPSPSPSHSDDSLQSSQDLEGSSQQSGDDGEEKAAPATEKEEKPEGTPTVSKKRKMKKKVVIKRVRRRLSTDGVPGRQDSIETAEPEICEKELKPAEPEPEPEPELAEENIPPGPKSCLKLREFQPGDLVLYNDRIKKVSKWKKAVVLERITSISYKLSVEGEEKSCHICYMKKYTDKKVQFGGKEYLEIDYAQEDEDEEEEPYNIWARV